MEGGIYISPEFQLGQVYDGAADVVEDVILYRPVYVCAPRPPGSDIGNGHSPSVRGVDHTPSPSPVAGSPSAAAKQRASGVSPAGSVEHINAHSSPSHAKSTATRTTKKVESTTTTTTTVDGRSNEHHHQHHHHYHQPPRQQQKEELSEPLPHYRSSHEVIVHGTTPVDRGWRDADPAKPTVTASVSEKEATQRDDVRLTDSVDTSSSVPTKQEAVVAETATSGVQDGVVDSHQLTASSKHIKTPTKTTTTTSPTATTTVVGSQASVADAGDDDTTVIKDHIVPPPPPSSPAVMAASAAGDCNLTNLGNQDHCVDVAPAEREAVKPVCHQTPAN